MKVSIVIPIFNEEENINLLYERIKFVMDNTKNPYEIIFVDDGSKDNSLNILKKIQENDEKIIVISLRKNFGQTSAFAAGFDYATGDVIITMDGDLQNDPDDIPKLIELSKEYDIVSGWRKNRKDPFISRRLPSIIANWLISKVTGVKLHDYGCSLKAYRRDVLQNINLYGEMHRFIPAVASQYGVKITEVETKHHPRKYGKSKYGISRTFKVILDLIMIKFFQSFFSKPLRAFGPIGLASFFAGLIISLKLTFEKFYYHKDIGGRPLLILGVMLIIVGVQMLAMGILGEYLVRIYYETQKKPIYYIREIYTSKREN
ncbi:MAG: glycosyltransferase family 2 protein [Proteobacteria bacterium]|nr:glycosyltransferase family 2 protein [Pseudomonadota bacterium]